MSLRRGVAIASIGLAAGAAAFAVRSALEREPVTTAAAVPLRLGGANLRSSPLPAFHPGRPRLLDDRNVSIWAPVLRPVPATARPAGGAIVDTVGTQTPEGTANLVLVLRERVVAGRTWADVGLPSTSASRQGWVPRSALGGLHVVDTRLDIDVSRLTLTLLVNGAPAFRAAVGVGAPGTPTPTGQFYVRDKLTRYDSPFYGPIAFGTSARSRVLTDWPAGGYIGIHGTDEPALIPGRISHGCIRVRNEDLLRLGRLLPIGTPITIHGR